jgi:hypothetical protein
MQWLRPAPAPALCRLMPCPTHPKTEMCFGSFTSIPPLPLALALPPPLRRRRPVRWSTKPVALCPATPIVWCATPPTGQQHNTCHLQLQWEAGEQGERDERAENRGRLNAFMLVFGLTQVLHQLCEHNQIQSAHVFAAGNHTPHTSLTAQICHTTHEFDA